MKVFRVVAAALAAGVGGAEEASDRPVAASAPAAEPERIDVVYERLGVQNRTLEAVVQIVTRLEAVADQSDAAAELLSDQGDPTERLKRALDEVASERLRRIGDAASSPVVGEAHPAAAVASGGGAEDDEEPRREVAVEVVYAERGDEGKGRVVLTVHGSPYEAAVGHRLLLGEDTVEVVRIVEEADGGLTVVLRVNGGAVVRRRVRR